MAQKTSSISASGDDRTKDEAFHFSSLTLEQIRAMHANFARARAWDQFHSPRNILLALIGELGEITENFQWKPDQDCDNGLINWTEKERTALADELSDVLIYLVRLANQCHIDLTESFEAKTIEMPK